MQQKVKSPLGDNMDAHEYTKEKISRGRPGSECIKVPSYTMRHVVWIDFMQMNYNELLTIMPA